MDFDERESLLSLFKLNENESDLKHPILYYLLNKQFQSSEKEQEYHDMLSNDKIEQIKFDFELLDKVYAK